MRYNAQAFDEWIRGEFVALNSTLEGLYFEQSDRSNVDDVGDEVKQSLKEQGHAHVVALWREGNTGDGFESAFGVLGNVGMYLGALRRHELTNPAREQRSPFLEASSLALHLGTSLGMAPRFAAAHLTTRNLAVAGIRKSFTSLSDEFLFIDENARSMLCFQRAADALARIPVLGVSNPAVDVQFAAAAEALRAVIEINARLFRNLDVDQFFFSVRPYYKPYRVGRLEYRGANAGDFSGISEIDLLLGLCRANNPYYANVLADKMQFMVPSDQERLRECLRQRSILDEILSLMESHSETGWFKANSKAFLEVCDLFAETAVQHHDLLVNRFMAIPAGDLKQRHQSGVTASGPPLESLLRSLEMLRDFRMAKNRPDLDTRHADMAELRSRVRAERG